MRVIDVKRMARLEMKTMSLLVLFAREKSGKGVPSVGIVLNVFMVATILNASLLSFINSHMSS